MQQIDKLIVLQSSTKTQSFGMAIKRYL
jgi:hypothetical protein